MGDANAQLAQTVGSATCPRPPRNGRVLEATRAAFGILILVVATAVACASDDSARGGAGHDARQPLHL